MIDLRVGDCREVLATLPPKSVQCCVTSPPYFGLRDYGVDGQMGLEPTMAEYITGMVDVFRSVRDVLADDGTLWLNIGDSYWTDSPVRKTSGEAFSKTWDTSQTASNGGNRRSAAKSGTFKNKDLMMVPARLAIALQDDGWYLRSDIIWQKPNPMPESVTDRPTSAHEHIFLLTKSARYYYDADAVREETEPYRMKEPDGWQTGPGAHGSVHDEGRSKGKPVDGIYSGRNARNVWSIATHPFPGAHFATFPPEIPRRCILAGSIPFGAYEPDDLILTPTGEGERDDDPSLITGRAGMNRPRRAVESVRPMSRQEQAAYAEQLKFSPHRAEMEAQTGPTTFAHYMRTDRSGARPVPPTLLAEWIENGWIECVTIPPRVADPIRSTVLDPFAGAGTTGLVADRLGRNAILIELNPEYAEMARERIRNDAPLFAEVTP